jgi:sucrose-phosphate synthase
MNEYYIQLFSPHGLIRYHDPEIGRNKDTGGQVKYVLELLENLSRHPHVRKVDLFTRKIVDKKFSSAYAKEIGRINEKARIIRISCGGYNYRQKESLWDYLDEFVDRTIQFIEKQDDFPDVVHGHYADGNYIAGQLSEIYGIPFISTGHSLGRNKQKILLQQGLSQEKINEKFNMERRIDVEETTLRKSDTIIVSTQHEIEEQYNLYANKGEARFRVIPPGVNSDFFYPFYRFDMPSYKMTMEQEHALYRVNSEIERFLFNPAKPLILSIGRADKRKNFETLIQSYGQDKELQAMANLAIFAGVRKDITQMPDDEQKILTNLLLLLDKYDLYGKMAIPKKNDPKTEVPEIYRVAARKKGVFVNATPGENFGLTLVEAAACGLPVVASPSGGPKEILENCENGLLTDVENPAAIADALKKIIADQKLWEKFSANGIRLSNKNYSWEAHTDKYMEMVNELFQEKYNTSLTTFDKSSHGKKLAKAKLLLIADLDGTLVDKSKTDGLGELKEWLHASSPDVIFGIATGRNKEMTQQALKEYDLPRPDVFICSAGSEIYYTEKFIDDNGWCKHIDFRWEKEKLRKALASYAGLELQEPAAQRRFKLSYYANEIFTGEHLPALYKFIRESGLRAKILFTENRFLDLLPFRASKGSAVRYLSNKWKIPLERILTAGNSGNDLDMLKGKTKGIVVANYSAELEILRKSKSIYFASKGLSQGVLEGIQYYIDKDPTLAQSGILVNT